jgi:hypothetical protein
MDFVGSRILEQSWRFDIDFKIISVDVRFTIK